jgi:hypothetical protein
LFPRRRVRTALALPHTVVCVLLCCAPVLFAQPSRNGEKTTSSPAASMRPATDGMTVAAQVVDPPVTKPEPPPTKSTPPVPREDAPPRPAGPPAVEEVRPELYYLKNKDGALEPVLGFTYEDFYRLYRLDQKLQQGAKPPAFRFEKASLVGKVENGRAELKAEFQIVATQAGWTRVPLGMTSALLADAPKQAADGKATDSEQMVQFDATEGYVLWLNGHEGQSHSVVFERLLAPLVANGEESRLRLLLPRSLTSAEVRLSVPVAKAQVKTSDVAAVVVTKAVGETATEVSLTARGGELEVAWRAPTTTETQAVETRVIESTAAIRATIDDRSITWDAQLTVRSLREPIESFDVRLPAGAQLEPVTPGAYTVSISGDSPRVVNVTLRKPTAEPVTLRLICRRARDAGATELLDFAGFAVEGATRQSGAMVVSIDGDWRIAWRERSEVRDTEQPPESLAPPEDQQSYSFEFFRQPFALRGEISPQPTRLDVEPQYQVAVEADQMRLTAHLIYKVRGAKVSQVQLQLGGWEFDDIGPAGVVHAAGAVPGENGLLTIPLAQRMRSTFELTITAKRPLTSATRRVDFSLPSVTADVIAPPVLVIESADNVDLMPVEAELSQLTPRSGGPPATMKIEKRRHPPLVYRALGAGREARFVANRSLRTREVTAESTTEIAIGAADVSVEQQLDLRVAYEALNRVVLDVPAALAERRDVVYAIDGATVMPIAMDASALELTAIDSANTTVKPTAEDWFAPANAKTGAMRIALEPPMAVMEQCRVTIRYTNRSAAAGAEASYFVPLVTLVDATHLRSIVRVTSSVASQFMAEKPWEPVPGGSSPSLAARSSAVAEFRAMQPADAITLKTLAQPRRTTVHTTWIRTTLADGVRQDRVAFRIETDEPRLELALPAGARADRVAAWVDQRQIASTFVAATASSGESPRVRIELPTVRQATGASRGATNLRTIELLYNIDAASSLPGARNWEPPLVLGDVWHARTLWEVIMPMNEHVVADPEDYTPEFAWQWNAVVKWGDTPILPILSRRANQSPTELQRLTGATPQRIADGQTNRYLFSTNGPAKAIVFHTWSRSSIVLLASSLVIALALLFVYVSAAKRPAMLVLVGVSLLGVAVWSPATAILGAQAAVVGLLVALVAGVASYWLKDRTAPAPSTITTHSDRVERVERGSSANRPRRDDRSQATTLTVPAELDVADLNS